MANSCSGGYAQLKEPAAMRLPRVTIKRRMDGRRFTSALIWGATAERLVNAIAIEIEPELFQFSRQVRGIPEQYAVKVLTPDRPDQAFYEGMGYWDVRNRLDLVDLEYAQVGEPPVESKHRIVVGAQVSR